MKIDSKKTYRVKRYTSVQMDCDYGNLPGSDVRRILKGCKYEKYDWDTVGLWYSRSGRFAYGVKEVE